MPLLHPDCSEQEKEIGLLRDAAETLAKDLKLAREERDIVNADYQKACKRVTVLERIALKDKQYVVDTKKKFNGLRAEVAKAHQERDAARAKRIKETTKRQKTRTELIEVTKSYNALMRRTRMAGAITVTEGKPT